MSRISNRSTQADTAPRVFLVMTQLERAGIQSVAFMQARHLHRNGYLVTMCFLYDKYGLLETLRGEEPYRLLCLDAKVLGGSRLANAARTTRALWRLYRLLRREQVQIVETLGHYSNILGIMAAWMARVPVRISSQQNTLNRFPKWFLRLDAWVVNSRAVDTMVSVSEETRRFCIEVEGMNPDKLIVIPNAANVDRFDSFQWDTDQLARLRSSINIPLEARVIITVARMHVQKGHTYLIRAAPRILAGCPGVVFLLVGHGEERSAIERELQRAQLEGYFRLLGVRTDIPQLLALSDLFVLPSIDEGMPLTVLEAMAARRAVVATSVDGTREIVVDGQTGLLVPPRDSALLAEAVIELLNDPSRRREMGKKGHQRVRAHFTELHMCRRYEELIQSKLQEHRR